MRLIAIGIIFTCASAFAAPAYVRSNLTAPFGTTGTTHTSALTNSSTAGNTVIAFVSWKAQAATMNYMCGGTSCNLTTSTGKFMPYTKAAPSASTSNQIWICRNCPSISTVTGSWSATTVADFQIEEYSGVVAIGQI